MNFFLLTAVPLAAVAAHRILYPNRPAFAAPGPWLRGLTWALAALVTAAFFGRLREFTGSFLAAFVGLTVTDALLVPGVVLAAWILTRKGKDPWELGLWLALVFTFAGIRDFAATSRLYDLNELFLVPLDRVLILTALPPVVARVLEAEKPSQLWALAAATVGLLLTAPLFQVMSFAGWGWAVWPLTLGGTAAAVWLQKKAVPEV